MTRRVSERIDHDLAEDIKAFEKLLIRNCFLVPISLSQRKHRIVETRDEIRFVGDKIYISKDFLDIFERCPKDVQEELIYHFGLLMNKSVTIRTKHL